MRELAFWSTLAATALGTRWVLSQRPSSRIATDESIPEGELVQAYVWQSRLPTFRPLYKWLARRALRSTAPRGRVLDLSCGPGGLVEEMARQTPALELVGLDISSQMLRVASTRTSAFSPRVKWEQGSADQVPFPDATFDLVMSTFSLHHWPQPLPAFNEVYRVLKPGGRFMIFDFRRDMTNAAWLAAWLVQHTVDSKTIHLQDQPTATVQASYTPRELVELALTSQLPPWRVATGPFWLSLENASSP